MKQYTVTIPKVTYWFRILNKRIFKGELKPFASITIRNHRKAYAYCSGDFDLFGEPFYWLSIRPTFTSLSQFLEILAHEMVHAYQFMDEGKITHGKSFLIWHDEFKKHGFNLTVKVRDTHYEDCLGKKIKAIDSIKK
jgi:hypothetical protein